MRIIGNTKLWGGMPCAGQRARSICRGAGLCLLAILLLGAALAAADDTGSRAGNVSNDRATYREVYPRPGRAGGNKAAETIARRNLPAPTRPGVPFVRNDPSQGRSNNIGNQRHGKHGRFRRSSRYARTAEPGLQPTHDAHGRTGARRTGRGNVLGFATERGVYFSDGSFAPAEGYQSENSKEFGDEEPSGSPSGEEFNESPENPAQEAAGALPATSIDPAARPRRVEVLGGPQLLIIERPVSSDGPTSEARVLIRSFEGAEAERLLMVNDGPTSL